MSRVIVTVVRGGLGNQLFIYAAARALSLRTGRRLYIDTEQGFVGDGFRRSYALEDFPLEAEPLPAEWRIGPSLRHPRHRLVRTLNHFLPRSFRRYHAQRLDRDETQLTRLVPRARRVTLVGYWQSERYFADHLPIIHQECMPPAPADADNVELGRQMVQCESVLVHVRRNGYFSLLSADYYRAAVEAIFRRCQRPHFYLFGDDLPWLQHSVDFAGAPVTAIRHNRGAAAADLWLMSRCRHAIVANSTFSWWGAWLGGARPGRQVLFPANPGFPLQRAAGWDTAPCSLVAGAGIPRTTERRRA